MTVKRTKRKTIKKNATNILYMCKIIKIQEGSSLLVKRRFCDEHGHTGEIGHRGRYPNSYSCAHTQSNYAKILICKTCI